MEHTPIAIVTGGSRGIGRAIVACLVRDGFSVLFTHSNSETEADAVAAAFPGRARALRADVAAPGAAAAIFDAAEALGPVAALVNNAGVTGRLGPFVELTDDDLERVVAVNLLAVTRLCREAARRWRSGAIVNLSSVAARTGSPGEYVAYAATKAAVDALTRGLARELGPRGIRVNAVAPGTVDTTIHARAGMPDRAAKVAAKIPLGRPGHAEEIAEAVAWLLSEKASFVTGAVLEATGGL